MTAVLPGSFEAPAVWTRHWVLEKSGPLRQPAEGGVRTWFARRFVRHRCPKFLGDGAGREACPRRWVGTA